MCVRLPSFLYPASRPSSLHRTTSSNSNNNSHLASPLEGKGTLLGLPPPQFMSINVFVYSVWMFVFCQTFCNFTLVRPVCLDLKAKSCYVLKKNCQFLSSSKPIISSSSSYCSPTGTLNGRLSRPQSESSGEFSLSLDQEVWSSSGSSPVQQPTSSRSSHQSPLQLCRPPEPSGSTSSSGPSQVKKVASPSEVLSLQQFLDEGIDPAEVGPCKLSCFF